MYFYKTKLVSNVAEDALNFWSSVLHPFGVGISGVHHRTRFIWCWGLNPGLQSHYASILSTVLHLQSPGRELQSTFIKLRFAANPVWFNYQAQFPHGSGSRDVCANPAVYFQGIHTLTLKLCGVRCKEFILSALEARSWVIKC